MSTNPQPINLLDLVHCEQMKQSPNTDCWKSTDFSKVASIKKGKNVCLEKYFSLENRNA